MDTSLMQGADSVRGYFPLGTWYSLMGGPTVDAEEKGQSVELKAPLGEVPVHVLGGSIIPMQALPIAPSEPGNSPEDLCADVSGHVLGTPATSYCVP